jgi:hypothetical protein
MGTGRAADRQTALDFDANEFVDLDNGALEDVGEVDLVFDLIGGNIGKRSAHRGRMKDMPDLFELATQQFLLGLSKHLDPFDQFWWGSA